MSINLYQVVNWEKNFEGAKSKTYINKTKCSMPTKHGLGYKRLIKSKDGASLFGAWCALVQVLSRHGYPRHGYCTDTGLPPSKGGIPYSSEDLELITDIDSGFFEEMFKICSSQSVGWIKVMKATDTTEIPQSPEKDSKYPLNSDSNLDLNSNLNSNLKKKKTVVAWQKNIPKPTEENIFRFMHGYAQENGFDLPQGKGGALARDIIAFYDANGWKKKNATSQMKDWRQSARTWIEKRIEDGNIKRRR